MSMQSSQQRPPKGWRDDPIEEVADDQFRRAPWAKRVAELIDDNHSSDSSVVYGLEGPWGSGKTSSITFVTQFLAARSDRNWELVTFTPWATSGTEGLFAEFFAALSMLAPKDNTEKFRDLVTSYARIAKPFAAMIPVVGKAAEELVGALGRGSEKPWNVAFKELSHALQQLHVSVLVVVDDIDRLQPRELLDLLKVVRLLGRFPGVDFLLAYDEESLVETMQALAQGAYPKARARAFMEKIVQYPLSIPPLLTSQIIAMLDAGLAEIVAPARVENTFDKHRISDIVLTTMPRQLTTPRAIERFLAQVREQFRAHDLDEIDDVDLILATFLKVQFPDVFIRLQRHKAALTRVIYDIARSGHEQEKPDWTSLVEEVDRDDDRHDALSVLAALFPAVKGNAYSRAPARRFAHPDYFDRYLAQGIPDGDIPDTLISRALEKAASGDASILRCLLNDSETEKMLLALSKIRDRYPDIIEDRQMEGRSGPDTLDMLQVVMTLIDEAPHDRPGSWAPPGEQLRDWAATLLRRLLNADAQLDVDPALLNCANVDRRARVVSTAQHRLEGLSESTKNALNEVLLREVGRILPALIRHLRERDDADVESRCGFLFSLVAESPSSELLRAQISDGVEEGEFSLEDVGARLVNLQFLVGGSGLPTGAAFPGPLFTKITGVPADSGDTMAEGPEWPDISWQRRRQFAARFINLTTPTQNASAVERDRS